MGDRTSREWVRMLREVRDILARVDMGEVLAETWYRNALTLAAALSAQARLERLIRHNVIDSQPRIDES